MRSDEDDLFAGKQSGDGQGVWPRNGEARQPRRLRASPDDKGTVGALCLPHPDWLRHELTVSGTAEAMARFQQAAAGLGVIPWGAHDLDFEEEDRVMALVHPPDGSRGLDLASARVLARELREARLAAGQKIRASVASGEHRACPFDLQALVPVPPYILARGPDDQASLAWLQSHWGTTWPLRHVHIIPKKSERRGRKTTQIKMEFWSADWTPWAALATIRQNWPAIRFDVRVVYDDG